ncbi:retrovirus-related pol polyprotein from transposon TNT 1-94 [Tanacetum coccineum]
MVWVGDYDVKAYDASHGMGSGAVGWAGVMAPSHGAAVPNALRVTFNTIITSLKAIDESFSIRNHVRKFLRALPTKWRPKVMAIDESKDLSTLPLDELIGNLKVYEVVLEKDLETSRNKKEKYKSLTLKARKVLSEEEATSSDSNDEEYAMAVRDFKKFFRRRGKFVRQPHDDKRNFRKAKEDKKEKDDRRCFNEDDSKKEEICLMALDDNEVLSDTPYYSSSSLDNESWQNEYDKLCKISLRIINKNKQLKAKNEELKREACELETRVEQLERNKEISRECIFLGYSPNSKAYVILNRETMRVKESLNMKFNKSPPPKTPPLEDDDVLENENIERQEKDLEIKENEPLNKEIPNIKESKDHPLETVIDVKSAFLNDFINEEVFVAQPPGVIDFEKPNHVFKLKKALYGLKQAPKAWYDRLKAFLINYNYTLGLVDNTLFTKKRKSHIIIVQIYVDDIIFGSTCQDLCSDFSKIMHDEFEMSMMGELNFFLGLQIKQLEDKICFNQSKYVKEMLKKFGLEDTKPIKTPMASKTKLTRDEDGEPTNDTKYRGMIGTGVETNVYADSDHAGDYVKFKSTSGVCTFMGCCLTSWFSKKQTALAISTTEAEYVSAGKACQQALWMKQALVDYDINLDNIPVLCDNKGAIDLSKNPVLHSRTKHIEIRHHFLRDNVQKGNILIEKVSSEDNIADILTKPLKRETFNLLRLGLGLMEPNA